MTPRERQVVAELVEGMVEPRDRGETWGEWSAASNTITAIVNWPALLRSGTE